MSSSEYGHQDESSRGRTRSTKGGSIKQVENGDRVMSAGSSSSSSKSSMSSKSPKSPKSPAKVEPQPPQQPQTPTSKNLPKVPEPSSPPLPTAVTTNNNVLNDTTLNRFIEIQTQIEKFEQQGIFDGLRLVEEEFERLEKSKRQAEINHKVLEEQTKKEKQDFENISQPTVQSFFKNKQAHNMAISKEQVTFCFCTLIIEIKITIKQLFYHIARVFELAECIGDCS
jgi:hypothetical protein